MINFLNAVLNIGIVDLTYDNTERVPHSEEERKAQFDLHCITGTGERVIIEMQNHSQEFFKDRTVYYAAFPIQEQAPRGTDWDFMLKPVYSVNIVNFRMEKTEELQEPQELKKLQKAEKLKEAEEKFISYVQLIDRDTQKVFYEKLTLVYLELPLFAKKEYELQTGIEQWTFVLKNLPKLNGLPDTLRNEVFEKLFQMAEIAKLSAKDRKEYYRSLKSYRDMNNYIVQRDRKIDEQSRIITEYRKENAAYQRENAELRRRLGLNDINVN
jgi:predicted transposase/invertase (TIGR01784 family)